MGVSNPVRVRWGLQRFRSNPSMQIQPWAILLVPRNHRHSVLWTKINEHVCDQLRKLMPWI
eukprot:NODE_2949_length_618_cov_73.869947_g2458_i0.p4 GENE.NODE_2949_length_618_cov_73.869947_g2458_i0~~NODE_2949_length_618_cov_73.869947_g2458_i0.p4  ORF type:complete len:61 (-),score=0.85 NODE_2949_length_618_cov_73.869947_g2458_i0:105-287(-)